MHHYSLVEFPIPKPLAKTLVHSMLLSTLIENLIDVGICSFSSFMMSVEAACVPVHPNVFSVGLKHTKTF